MIPRRPLGRAGIDIPVLGFGVSGPLGAAVTTSAQITALVRAAYDGGAAFFDTAPFYGDAERRLGGALAGLPRASFVLATKAGERGSDGRIRKDFTAAGVRASLLKSLAALRTDHVDLFFLHGPAPAHLTPALLEGLATLQTEGLVRAVGVCARDHAVDAALAAGIAVIQAPVEGGWAEKAAAAGAGFIGIEALRAAAPDLRAPASLADLWYLARGLARGARPAPRGDAAAALSAALARPGVASVLFTTTRLAHLRANLAAAAMAR